MHVVVNKSDLLRLDKVDKVDLVDNRFRLAKLALVYVQN